MNWWIDRQNKDPFVRKREECNYRSRASFKLLSILKKYHLNGLKGTFLDLGAAPGGWTQVLQEKFPKQKIIACDLLSMDPLPGVDIIQGDFTTAEVQNLIAEKTYDGEVSVIFSDMAPNFTGYRLVEHARIENISDCVLLAAKRLLNPKGFTIQKIFHGPSFESILKRWRATFVKVDCFKPEASRKESAEIYLIAHQLKNAQPAKQD
jgi:23S rRNA (uridine2552-2'-O)-methyltransferase